MLQDNISKYAELLIQSLRIQGFKIRCVESCTAGSLTASLGALAGVSDVLDRSWITYSNQAKHEEVGVSLMLLDTYGAVSQEVVLAMANGAVLGCETHTVSISISGIAGPGGGSPTKPVGTVWLGVKKPYHQPKAQHCALHGSRHDIQQQAVLQALMFCLSYLED